MQWGQPQRGVYLLRPIQRSRARVGHLSLQSRIDITVSSIVSR